MTKNGARKLKAWVFGAGFVVSRRHRGRGNGVGSATHDADPARSPGACQASSGDFCGDGAPRASDEAVPAPGPNTTGQLANRGLHAATRDPLPLCLAERVYASERYPFRGVIPSVGEHVTAHRAGGGP